MQIICPNCGSQSPIEAGSLVTQTRIVCARCAVEFSAELSDEQQTAPTFVADERGIELFRADEVAHISQPRPVSVPEVAAPAEPAEVALAEAEFAAAPVHEVLPTAETLPAAEVSTEVLPAFEVAAVEAAAPAVEDSPASGEAHEVLSLPEDALPANEPAAAGVAEADQSNVLEDVFAAWSQARESKSAADATEAVPVAAAEDYVTSPLSADYEAASREDHQRDVDSAERPSAEVLEASTKALEAATGEPVKPVEEDAEEAAEAEAEAADDWREPAQPASADAHVAPQVASAQSFDGYGLGVRLMRVSPLWLLVSGLSFISFVVFCNWFFVPANLAQAEAARPASRRNEATNRPLTNAASTTDLAAARPDSRNSNTSSASLPGEAEIVNASVKTGETTPAPTAAPATPAPTAEPTATPQVEQPKAVEAVAPQPASGGKFTLQVGSYNAPGEAEARASNLRSAGQSVRVVEVEIPRRGKWYRVYVGGFASRTDAESHGRGLRERGLAESYIATESQ